jgi:hypothetical protein
MASAAGTLVCVPAAETSAYAQNTPVVARAASISGHVTISTGGGTAFALTRGYALNPGDRVDTRGGGRLVIDLSDGSMVVVQPESVLIIKDYRQAESLRELFQIVLGQVRVKINHFAGRPNPYRMNSPTASIAVRGTEFTITVDNFGATEVDVYEGLVEVSSLTDPDRKVLIEAGRGVLVNAGQDFHLLGALQGPSGDRGDGGNRDRRVQVIRPDMRAPGADSRGQGPDMRGAPTEGRAGLPGPGLGPPAAAVPGAGTGPILGPLPGGDPRGLLRGDHDDLSPRAQASTYERYIAGLAEIGQVPFLLRFNAFPESHLDSLENPAFAGQFRTGEGRLFILPTFSGLGSFTDNTAAFGARGNQPATFSISPQLSMFVPVGSKVVIGGSATMSSIDSGHQAGALDFDTAGFGQPLTSVPRNSNGSSTSRFFSGSLLAARRFGENGSNSFGLELETLRGTGSLWHETVDTDASQTLIERTDAGSDINQTRFTAGVQHSFEGGHNIGLFYRYAWITANEADRNHVLGATSLPLESTQTSGHSSEFGLRLRGPLSPKLFYGVEASWLGLSLDEGLVRTQTPDSLQRDRAHRGTLGLGLGYLLNRRTVLSFDLAGGTSPATIARSETATGTLLQTGAGKNRFVSAHAAVQSDVWRRLFISASLLSIWQTHNLGFGLFPDSFGHITAIPSSFLPFAPMRASTRASDFGAGWRFSRDLFAQYVFSTDYGATSSSHTLMLRYTFHFGGE